MRVVQVLLGERLLAAIDRRAKKTGVSRSELVRRALAQYLLRERIRELEERHRSGYRRHPPDEFAAWDRVTAWPAD